MFSQLKKKSIVNIITTRWILLIVAAVTFYVGGSVNLIKMLHPLDFFDLTEENIDGAYVTGDVFFLYGEYMTTESRKNGKSQGITSASMIIDINGENYIGLEIPKKQIPAYESALEECINNIEDVSWIMEDPFSVSGTILKMDSEERGYFKEYIGDRYSEPEFMPYVLKVGYLGENKFSETLLYTAVGFILLAIFLFGFIKALTGMYQKPVRKFIDLQTNPDYEKNKLETAWQNAVTIGDMYAMREYVILMDGAVSRIMRPWDIVWIYKTVTSHRTYGIPTGKSFAITLATADGKQYKLTSKKNTVDYMMESVKRELPGAIVGYSPELRQMYQNNRASFSQNWNDIRNSIQ